MAFLADDPIAPPLPMETPPDFWAVVEIFGHRRHVGRIREAEQFGVKMLRVDVPVTGEPDRYRTYLYGGAAVFGLTPVTEGYAREQAKREAAPQLTYEPDFGEDD